MDLDPVLHQPQRLRIMAALQRNRQANFTSLREGLGLTAGNLHSHIAKLEEAGYITSGRTIVNARFELRYRITAAGDAAFNAYVDALKAILKAL